MLNGAVVGAGVGEEQKKPSLLWGDLQQFSRRPEDQAIPVPASGEVAEYLTAAVPEVLEHPEDGVPPQAAKAGHPHGYAAPGQALGQDVPLGGDGLLTVHPGGGGVQQQVHRKAGAGGVPFGRDYADAPAVEDAAREVRALERQVNHFAVDKVAGNQQGQTHKKTYHKYTSLKFQSRRVWLVQLLNIAGLGPIFGALSGSLWGPSVFLWITFGTIFAGGVHDYFAGMLSERNEGASVSEITGIYLGGGMKNVMRVFSVVLLIMVGTVFRRYSATGPGTASTGA